MQMGVSAANAKLSPGVRFHPTEEELVVHYLKRRVLGRPLDAGYVAEVDIYQFHPADLRDFACFSQEMNWYFFCPIGKKYGNGDRKSRSTHCGYWKPTGNPRTVKCRTRTVGKVRTLVFHLGKPSKGERTNWVQHEYSLEESELANNGVSDALVLCKIFNKERLGPRNGEQYGAPYNEEERNFGETINASVTVVVQDQSASIVMNELASANVNPLHPEQTYSSAVSVTGVYHAPTQASNASYNVAAADKMPAVDQDPVLNCFNGTCCPVEDGIYDGLDTIEDIEGMDLGDLALPLDP